MRWIDELRNIVCISCDYQFEIYEFIAKQIANKTCAIINYKSNKYFK